MDNNKKKIVISIVIIIVLIIIVIVGFFIYKNKKKQKEDAAAQMAILQEQLSQPNIPVSQKKSILEQIGTLAAIIGSNIPQKTGQGSNQVQEHNTNTNTNTSVPAPADFPLKKGSSGLFVKSVQKAVNSKCADKLKAMGAAKLVEDGKFGPLTERGIAACIGTTTVSWEQYKQLI